VDLRDVGLIQLRRLRARIVLVAPFGTNHFVTIFPVWCARPDAMTCFQGFRSAINDLCGSVSVGGDAFAQSRLSVASVADLKYE
jgi:hypothetical protein